MAYFGINLRMISKNTRAHFKKRQANNEGGIGRPPFWLSQWADKIGYKGDQKLKALARQVILGPRDDTYKVRKYFTIIVNERL